MGARIDEYDQVVEFGGGFGALCRLARRLGFRGRYALSRHRAAAQPAALVPARQRHARGRGRGDARFRHADPPVGEVSALLAEEGRRTAFLAHGSLETPIPLRDELLHTLRRTQVEAIWLIYRSNFGVHNAPLLLRRDQAVPERLRGRPPTPPAGCRVGRGDLRPCLPGAAARAGPGLPAGIRNLRPAPFETRTCAASPWRRSPASSAARSRPARRSRRSGSATARAG